MRLPSYGRGSYSFLLRGLRASVVDPILASMQGGFHPKPARFPAAADGSALPARTRQGIMLVKTPSR